jgi:UDP-4-amino-4,6-dideoxy-N-acetyl-beta-L-altrosamine transaminase
MIPYSRQDVSEEDIKAVCDVLRSDFLTQGPVLGTFEQSFAAKHHVAHAVAVTNATAGLQIACLALDVGAGARVWTSPNSFIASANCALYCGAAIDFVDIDPRTRNMSVPALKDKLAGAERANTLPKVVIPVDFAGLPCDMREIRELADRYGFKVLEDASHATGASYGGQPTGSAFADATVFSFHAVKIVTTAEGGIVTTPDKQLADRMRALRSHGMTRNPLEMERACEGAWYYEQQSLGFNFRMTEVQAALGLSQLARLDVMRARREALAARYDQLVAGLPLLIPARLPDRQSAWHLYVIEVDGARTAKTRAEVFEHLRNAGIGVNVHYIPIHTQPYYARLGFRRGDFPASERYYSRAISIPLYPALTESQQDRIVDALSGALA